MIPLRPYQLEGIEALRSRIRAGKRRPVFVLATGGGKTVVAAHIVDEAVRKGSRVIVAAHRRELIKQTFCKLIRNGLDASQVGIIMAGTPSKLVDAVAPDPATLSDDELWRIYARRRPTAPVQVASIDTLRRKTKPPAELFVIDECHRALAASYKQLVADYPEAVILGLTATPYRADNRGLGELFDDLVVIASPRLLVEEGFLVEPSVWTVPARSLPDLSGVRTRGGDYDQEQLAAAVDQAGLVGDLVEHWQKRAEGRRTVAFATSVEHSKHIESRFREAGVPAEHLDGTTPTEVRDAILGRLERGETLVVSNCGVLCEGWDQPAVKCAILARPTQSTGLYLQQAGRILRPWQGVSAIVLDHAGVVRAHGFPTDEREFGLDGKKKRPKAPSAKTCPECYAVMPSSLRVCPGCGYQFGSSESERLELEERDGELVQLSPEELASARWTEIVSDWQKKNRRRDKPWLPGWCFKRYVELYKSKPPTSCKLPELDPELRARRMRFERLAGEAEAHGYDPGWAHVRMRLEEPERLEFPS